MIYFLLGIVSVLWFQIGLYGVYLSTYNTNTHTERVRYIFQNPQDYFRIHCILLAIVLALLGPVMYLIVKIDHKRWELMEKYPVTQP